MHCLYSVKRLFKFKRKIIMLVFSRSWLAVSALGVFALVSACDSEPKEKKAGQALVSVNNKEITVLQLNDELKRANVRADQYESASKQLLESLIARQVIVDEAIRNKLDRSPEVLQARERANAQIIAQSYLQSLLGKIQKPSKTEIDDYYLQHPELLQQRKQFDLMVIRLATNDLTEEVKQVIDAAKSLDDVASWFDKQKISYNRGLSTRSTSDFPKEMSKALQEKERGTIFIINEQGNTLLISVIAIVDAPISIAMAAPQIERFLLNKKHKEAIETEIARLRSVAKIEYVGNIGSSKEEKAVSESLGSIGMEAEKGNLNLIESVSDGSIDRGIMGLK